MCSKCNGCLGETPTGAKQLLEESERKKKARENKKNPEKNPEKNPADEFMEGYIR